jgi:hypothetical protein
MNKKQTVQDFILQSDRIELIQAKLGKETWLTVYENCEIKTEFGCDSFCAYCALIPRSEQSKILENFGWEISISAHGPGFISSYENGNRINRYERFSGENFLPLVLKRCFYDAAEDYFEILEEFRLYHNLLEDKKTNEFFKINEEGLKEKIIKITENKIEIRTLEIRQFISAKDMVFASYFEARRYIPEELDDKTQKTIRHEIKDNSISLIRSGENYVFDTYNAKAFSRIVGKKIIQPLPIEKCGIWPFAGVDKQFEDFIVGTNENGDEILSTCDKDNLGNNFGANPDAYHYLTPIFFQRDVLTQYYSNSQRYEIQDGQVYCKGVWSLRVDNNHPDHIMVYLGDLGFLPLSEQKYWRSYNLPPEDKTMSRAYYMRSVMGEFSETESPDLRFKQSYKKLSELWLKKFGWHLFHPLSSNDEHYFHSLRVPLNEQQSEFDTQIHGLAKTIVDSINVQILIKSYAINIPEDRKGKSNGLFVFDEFLKIQDIQQIEGYINFLKDVQELRSSGTAHRKGKNYQKICDKLEIEKHGYKATCIEIFYTAENLMNELIKIASLSTQDAA